MGRRSHKRSTEQEENNVGCVWGLMRMLYFRRDAKFLLDTKQVSRRHTFREIADGRHSVKKSSDFEETDEDDNKEECTSQKRTVKKLMEDELGKVNLLKKIPNNEIQRRLPDLGYDGSLDGSSEHTNKPVAALNQHSDIFASYLSGSVYSQGTKSLNHSEEYDLESVLANFLGEVYRCHGECPHSDCKNKSELCPSLKSLIHNKLNDLNNPHSTHGIEQSQESKGEGLLGENSHSNNRAAEFKEFKDALEILSSNNELFLKLLQKPNSHILDNIQKHQNSRLTTKLEPDKSLGQSSILEEKRGSNHELATKTQGKETKHVFFWRKDKSDRKQKPERTTRPQPVSKIVILKPNQGRQIDETETTSSRYLHQQRCTSQAPEFSGRESSKFSIKGVKRRFKIVTGENKREKNAMPADNLQGDSHWPKDSVMAVKDPRHLTEVSLPDKAASNFKNGTKPSTSSKQKQQNDRQSEISDHIVASTGASIFYEEAKRHLADMLKDNSQSANRPTAQVTKSLEGMLSLPHCNMSSPRTRSDHRGKCHTALSPEEAEVCLVSVVDVEEPSQERSQLHDSESHTYCTSAAVDDQVVILEEYYQKKDTREGTRYAPDEVDALPVEGVDKLDCSKPVCNIQSIPAEQYTENPLPEILEETEGKEPVQMFMSSPESMIEKLEQQDPKTPEPRSPKLPDGSPEQSNEKKEQPSPVSVLDSFDEDDSSPECKTVKEYELHEDIHGTLYFPDNESGIKVFWEEKDARLDYIMLVLELSELCAEQNLEVWYLEDELISPCMFEELQNQGDSIDDMKLLFDCICEALTEIQERYFRLSSWLSFVKHDIRTPPVGENLISEVDKYVDGYLKCSFPSTLEQIIKRDLEVQTWMDIRSKTEGIVVEIWEFVLDELMDEAVFDLWI
ncbi:hypothetical protein E2562_006062 [Oryza meyeriana var. granulata]|uniref:DUF4378 domain-containing protein n=1 Tax=Oryza meyeriana var. granulata TaxID=110450 RepID=A0A6G1EVJ0_9ORYZ|nr:hypothetical protein E2562_006062 [Oryza meyeriana var. granulata]